MRPAEPTSGVRPGEAPLAEAAIWTLGGDGLSLRAPRHGPLAELLAGPPDTLAELVAALAIPDDADRLVEAVRAAAEDLAPRHCLHRARLAPHRVVRLESWIACPPDGAGVTGLTVLRPRRERWARAFKDLVDARPAAVLQLDLAGQLRHVLGLRLPWAEEPDARPTWLKEAIARALDGSAARAVGSVGEESFEVHAVPEGRGARAVILDITAELWSRIEAPHRLSDLRGVLDSVADAVTIMRADGVTTFLNRAARLALGLTPDAQLESTESMRKTAEAYLYWDEQGGPLRFDDLPPAKALLGQEPPAQLIRVRAPGRSEDAWTMARARPIFDARGTLQLVVGIWTDVTGFQRAREALTRESALLRALNEASQDGVLMVSPDGRVLFFNRRFLDVTRPPFHPTAEGEDAPLLAAVAGEMRDPESFVARVKAIYGAPLTTSRDELALRDGRIVDRYSAPVQGPTGEIYGRVWFFRDITEHKLAKERERLLLQEQAARAEAEKQRRDWEFLAEAGNRMGGSLDADRLVSTLLQLSLERLAPCAIIDLVSSDGALRRVAAAHADPSHAMLVERLRVIQPDAEAPTGAAGTMRSGRSRLVDLQATSEGPMNWSPLGERGAGSLEILCSLGGRWLLTVPLQAREHRLGALSLVRHEAFEPGERRLAEEVASRAAMALESAMLYREAQGAIGMRDDFLSVASHELRTPVTALRLALQALARMAPSLPEAASKLVRAAERYELRLSKLIDTLLDVTRLEGRKLALELEEVDLSAVAAEVVQLFSAEAQHADSEVTLRTPGPVIGVWDRSRLEQVVANLLSNAIKYGKRRPVELEVSASPDRARLLVRDHGIGVPTDRRAAIFGRFERAVSSRNYAGLGLGLYIARGIARALGGDIELESTPGVGSVFTLDLPRVTPEGA
ncbi:MAG: PAS domain-containing protein [Deltaproteobacteria bacterium]|nr:PAS domain-containing protein [Deltaproteobacteria bacterium]